MPTLPADQRARIRLLQLAALPLFLLFLTINPAFSQDGSSVIEMIGITLVLFCVAGRMWSILYIGSKKNQDLVTVGPYSMTRNPLYFFSMIGAAGIGLFVGSLVFAVLLALLVYLVLLGTARKEAAHLEELFSNDYVTYARRTPMFWPRLSLYRDAEQVTFSPAALRRTFRDGLLFFVALFAIEMFELLKEANYIPMLVDLL